MFDPALNAALQELHHPALDLFFQLVTALGYGVVVAAALMAIYWTWDKQKAFALIQFVVYSDILNHLLKEICQMPRPFQVAPDQVEVLDLVMRRALTEGGLVWAVPAKTSYSFPSGHAQVSVCLWGALALHARRPAVTVAALALIFLVSLSRVYLGVHFLGDVLGGLAVGGALLVPYYLVAVGRAGSRRWFTSAAFRRTLALLAPIAAFLLRPDVVVARSAALLLGLAAGHVIESRWVGFSASGSTLRRTARVPVGLMLLGAAYWLLSRLRAMPSADFFLADPILYSGCLYLLIGLLAALVIPFLFVLVRLSRRADTRRAD